MAYLTHTSPSLAVREGLRVGFLIPAAAVAALLLLGCAILDRLL